MVIGFNWPIFKLQLTALGGLLFLSLSVTWLILYYVRLMFKINRNPVCLFQHIGIFNTINLL